MLLSAGAHPNPAGRVGPTPEECALRGGHAHTAQLVARFEFTHRAIVPLQLLSFAKVAI